MQNYYFFFNRPNFFLNFAPENGHFACFRWFLTEKMRILTMNWFKKSLDWLLGIPMVCIGVAVLAASYFTGLSHVNAVLLTGFGLVLGGAVAWVWKEKRG